MMTSVTTRRGWQVHSTTPRKHRTDGRDGCRALHLEALEDRCVLSITLAPLGTYASGIFDDSAAEIVSYDSGSEQLFVTNSAQERIDVLDASDPSNPVFVAALDTGGNPTSVTTSGGLVAVSVAADPETDPGNVQFFNASTLAFLGSVTVGALPDMLTFTPDGTRVLVANEGQPNDEYTIDPEGSVSMIDATGIPLDGSSFPDAASIVTTIGFTQYNGQEQSLNAKGVRIFGPGATAAQDFEPEYIAVSQDSSTAWVTLQENNALAIIDLDSAQVTAVRALGYKNYQAAGNGFDASNRDAGINIQNWPVKGMYQPDAIAAYSVGEETFVVTANEGDARDYDGFSEETRIRDLKLSMGDNMRAAELQQNENLGRLLTTTSPPTGKTINGGEEVYHQLYSYGARSFTIWNAEGNRVFDSGDDFEQITAARLPDDFNSNDQNDSFDSRSDDKGPEPEGVVVGEIAGHSYAFVCLERIGGIMIYDITDPHAPIFQDYVTTRVFRDADGNPVDTETEGGDVSPEGLKFIDAAHSPNGEPLLAVAFEVSGTTTIYQVTDLVAAPVVPAAETLVGAALLPGSTHTVDTSLEKEQTESNSRHAVRRAQDLDPLTIESPSTPSSDLNAVEEVFASDDLSEDLLDDLLSEAA